MILILPELTKWDILRCLYTICTTLNLTTQEAETKIRAIAKEQGISFIQAAMELTDIAWDLYISRQLKAESDYDHTFGY